MTSQKMIFLKSYGFYSFGQNSPSEKSSHAKKKKGGFSALQLKVQNASCGNL